MLESTHHNLGTPLIFFSVSFDSGLVGVHPGLSYTIQHDWTDFSVLLHLWTLFSLSVGEYCQCSETRAVGPELLSPNSLSLVRPRLHQSVGRWGGGRWRQSDCRSLPFYLHPLFSFMALPCLLSTLHPTRVFSHLLCVHIHEECLLL